MLGDTKLGVRSRKPQIPRKQVTKEPKIIDTSTSVRDTLNILMPQLNRIENDIKEIKATLNNDNEPE